MSEHTIFASAKYVGQLVTQVDVSELTNKRKLEHEADAMQILLTPTYRD